MILLLLREIFVKTIICSFLYIFQSVSSVGSFVQFFIHKCSLVFSSVQNQLSLDLYEKYFHEKVYNFKGFKMCFKMCPDKFIKMVQTWFCRKHFWKELALLVRIKLMIVYVYIFPFIFPFLSHFDSTCPNFIIIDKKLRWRETTI